MSSSDRWKRSYDSWKSRSDLDDWAAQNHEPPEDEFDGPPEPESDEPFSVCQFFEDGSCEWVRRDVGAEEAVKAAHHYTHNVASRLGLVKRVIITDGEDYCVFCWTREEGITFPPRGQS